MTPKEEGLKRVKENNKADYLKLLSFAREWVKIQRRPFTSEDLKTAFIKLNKPPQQPNIYGAVMNSLSHEKVIKPNGYTTAKLPSAHGRLLHEWISIEYSLQQSANRKNPTAQITGYWN